MRYSITLFGIDNFENFLVYVWSSSFTKFDAKCIHWIALRLTIWIYVFFIMMCLENCFTVYLFIRQRNYITLFVKMYGKCLLAVGTYYGLAMVIMGLLIAIITQDISYIRIIADKTIIKIIVLECLDCLNLCLFAYLLYCCSKRMEISFVLALVGRLLFQCFLEGKQIEMPLKLGVNLLLTVGVLLYSSYNFMERVREY